MTVYQVCKTLDAKVVCGKNSMDKDVHNACGSDMLSDVLAFVKDQSVLLTGLCNPQVIRTAEMMDIICIVFVRGKEPDKAMVELADTLGITLLTTSHRMFSACGLLYEKGLRGGASY
ncbi:MAG: DRTGG domain-containing protein [bacterium]|nr:DRTGG domain-containing protein [bacterium]